MVCKKYDCILSNEIACFKSDLIKSMTVDFEIFPTVKQKHKKVMGWQLSFPVVSVIMKRSWMMSLEKN